MSKREAALQERELKLAKLQELERRSLLPHLYGYKWYKWAWEFFTCRNRMGLLTAANQVSKSSTQIRTIIDWATDKSKWVELWPTEDFTNKAPVFWYLYPDSTLATTEFKDKWIPEFMPRGRMKEDPIYGWEDEYDTRKKIYCVRFKSGVVIYFKSYAQDVHSLQGSTVHAIFTDEELPENLYSELYFRLNSTNGYFRMVFTATRSQELFRCAMEEIGTRFEKFKGAWKKSVSLYECQEYMDGTKSKWTEERIRETIDNCKDENEVQRRVMGRFVRSDNRRYVFSKNKNYVTPLPEDWKETPPDDWHIFVGVDIGSGLPGGAPSAIYFTAVRPDFKYGRIYKGWRGDGTLTTAGDVFKKYTEMKEKQPLMASYDWGSSDFGLIASSNSEPFVKAMKDRTKGDEILNTLFKFGMLVIDDVGDLELEKLANEFTNLGVDSISGDDAADSTRYGIVPVPWDFTGIKKNLKVEKAIDEMSQLDQRRGGHVTDTLPEPMWSVESELAEWSDMYD